LARPKQYVETVMARLVAGTWARMDAVLAPDKTRGDFVRTAIEELLKRRERELKRQELAGRLTRLRAPR
jgi:hypothetical protein